MREAVVKPYICFFIGVFKKVRSLFKRRCSALNVLSSVYKALLVKYVTTRGSSWQPLYFSPNGVFKNDCSLFKRWISAWKKLLKRFSINCFIFSSAQIIKCRFTTACNVRGNGVKRFLRGYRSLLDISYCFTTHLDWFTCSVWSVSYAPINHSWMDISYRFTKTYLDCFPTARNVRGGNIRPARLLLHKELYIYKWTDGHASLPLRTCAVSVWSVS